MDRGRAVDSKAPRKLFDHKAGKFVTEDQEGWKGINRPPTADKGAVKSGDKSNIGTSMGGGKDSRDRGQAGGGGGSGGREEGVSRSILKKQALGERRRRDKEGRANVDDEDAVTRKENDREKRPPSKRLLTRDGAQGRGAAARHDIVGADGSVGGVGGWMAGMAGALGGGGAGGGGAGLANDIFHELDVANASRSASLGLHDGDMGGIQFSLYTKCTHRHDCIEYCPYIHTGLCRIPSMCICSCMIATLAVFEIVEICCIRKKCIHIQIDGCGFCFFRICWYFILSCL